jgi:hypothetical protein
MRPPSSYRDLLLGLRSSARSIPEGPSREKHDPPNFLGLRYELLRTILPRTPVNRGKKKGRGCEAPNPSMHTLGGTALTVKLVTEER